MTLPSPLKALTTLLPCLEPKMQQCLWQGVAKLQDLDDMCYWAIAATFPKEIAAVKDLPPLWKEATYDAIVPEITVLNVVHHLFSLIPWPRGQLVRDPTRLKEYFASEPVAQKTIGTVEVVWVFPNMNDLWHLEALLYNVLGVKVIFYHLLHPTRLTPKPQWLRWLALFSPCVPHYAADVKAVAHELATSLRLPLDVAYLIAKDALLYRLTVVALGDNHWMLDGQVDTTLSVMEALRGV